MRNDLLRLAVTLLVAAVLGVAFETSLRGALGGALLGTLALLLYMIWQRHTFWQWLTDVRRGRHPLDLGSYWQAHRYEVESLEARFLKEKQRLETLVTRVRDMTSALEDAVVLVDRRGNIEWWNPAAGEMFKFRDADLGHKLTNLIRHPVFVRYFEAGEFREPLDMTLWRDELQVEFRVHPFGSGERLVTVRDITRLWRLERMRKDFVANVSHELRTPLTVIRGYMETLQDLPGMPGTAQKALTQVDAQCQRMTQLISDLIALSKLETDGKDHVHQRVPVRPLLDAIAIEVAKLPGGQRDRIAVHCPDELILIGSEQELRSAFTNLAVNAVNYAGANATIVLSGAFTDTGADVCVTDNGIGIDSKHLPRLTERFYRVDSARSMASGGTGLGLAIVKHILLRHNGELVIHSELGRGSRFCCTFPAARVASPPHKVEASA